MNYRDTVIEYAKIIQMTSAYSETLDLKVNEKIASYPTDLDKKQFWKTIQGMLYRTVGKAPYRILRAREIKYRNFITEIPGVDFIINSPNLRDWVSALPLFKREIDYINSFHTQMRIREKPSEIQKTMMSKEALMFYNNAVNEDPSIGNLVRYIPLVYLTLTDLLATDNYSHAFNDFVIGNVVPVLRAHGKIVEEFLDLLERENELDVVLRESDSPATLEEIEDKYRSKVFEMDGVQTVDTSHTQDMNLEPPKLAYQPVPAENDPYSLLFGSEVEIFNVVRGEKSTARTLTSNVIKSWKLSPLSDLLYLRTLADMLGVAGEYTAVVPPRVLENATRILYNNIKFYKPESLIQFLFNGLDICIYDYQAGGMTNKPLYHSRFQQLVEVLEVQIDKLIQLGLLPAPMALQELEVRLERGEQLGLWTTF